VLIIPEVGCMSYASTATIKPNIQRILVHGFAQAQILRDPAILIDRVVVGRQKCIYATSSCPIHSRTTHPWMDATSHVDS
jgi:hypothetical protein